MDAPCAQCGATDNVVYLSPDMDIAPVPLCLICRWTLFHQECREFGCHDTLSDPTA
jgi:hypothetical protein